MQNDKALPEKNKASGSYKKNKVGSILGSNKKVWNGQEKTPIPNHCAKKALEKNQIKD
jgi:hypothetical protein